MCPGAGFEGGFSRVCLVTSDEPRFHTINFVQRRRNAQAKRCVSAALRRHLVERLNRLACCAIRWFMQAWCSSRLSVAACR